MCVCVCMFWCIKEHEVTGKDIERVHCCVTGEETEHTQPSKSLKILPLLFPFFSLPSPFFCQSIHQLSIFISQSFPLLKRERWGVSECGMEPGCVKQQLAGSQSAPLGAVDDYRSMHATSHNHTRSSTESSADGLRQGPPSRHTVCEEMCAMTSCSSPSLPTVISPTPTTCLSNVLFCLLDEHQSGMSVSLTLILANHLNIWFFCLWIHWTKLIFLEKIIMRLQCLKLGTAETKCCFNNPSSSTRSRSEAVGCDEAHSSVKSSQAKEGGKRRETYGARSGS